jgi:hypothetical protein
LANEKANPKGRLWNTLVNGFQPSVDPQSRGCFVEEARMIESLYIVDSSGLCLFSSPLGSSKILEPNLLCGFITAQNQYFKAAFGENTSKFTLEKKEIILQMVNFENRSLLLAISYTVDDKKEEKFSKIILNNLAKALRSKQVALTIMIEGSTETLGEELGKIVEGTMSSIPCLYLVKGFLGITDHCNKVDAPITDGRPCDFNYAVRQCNYYMPRTS